MIEIVLAVDRSSPCVYDAFDVNEWRTVTSFMALNNFVLTQKMGTPSASRARPKKKNISKTPKRVKKWPLSFVDMLNAPDSLANQERAEVIATVSTSMVSHPQSIGEASEAQ
ncbi:hypothetical protein SUGI_1205920, partial [Cryptomeria japonica]